MTWLPSSSSSSSSSFDPFRPQIYDSLFNSLTFFLVRVGVRVIILDSFVCLRNYYYYYFYYYGFIALCWALAAFSVSWSYTQSVGLPEQGISPLQGLCRHTEQYKHSINGHNTDTHALNWIRTDEPSFRTSEDSSYLRPGSHCHRPSLLY
jgi:hypothetical protein